MSPPVRIMQPFSIILIIIVRSVLEFYEGQRTSKNSIARYCLSPLIDAAVYFVYIDSSHISRPASAPLRAIFRDMFIR